MSKEIKSNIDLLANKDVSIDNLMDEIEAFDKYHNMGSMLARYVMQLGKDEKNTVFENDKSAVHAQTIVTKYGDVLNEIGLSFEPVNSTVKAFHQDGETEAKKLNFNIADGEKFAGYLGKMGQKIISQKEHKFIKKTLNTLVEQFEHTYDYENPAGDENFLNAVVGLKEIVKGYETIDQNHDGSLSKEVNKLAQFEKRISKGCLKEYIYASKHGLTDDFTEWTKAFTPATWHGDCTVDRYRNRWKNICFKSLDNFKNNPKASEEYADLVQKLKQAIEYAKVDIEERIEKNNNVNYVLLLNALKQEIGTIEKELMKYDL